MDPHPFCALSAPPDAGGDVGLAVGLGILAVMVGVLFALNNLIGKLRQVDERLARLDSLKAIEGDLRSIVEDQSELDLRRLEHVLIDIRDGQKRVEERMLAVLEAGQLEAGKAAGGEGEAPSGARSGSATGAAAAGRSAALGGRAGGPALGDRIVTRLLALGYERVEILTPAEELAEFARRDGEVVLEARRHGAAHKGKVVITDGGIADIQLRAAYELFP